MKLCEHFYQRRQPCPAANIFFPFYDYWPHGRYFTRSALLLLDLTVPFSTHFPNSCCRNQWFHVRAASLLSMFSRSGKRTTTIFYFPPVSRVGAGHSYQDMRKTLKSLRWHFFFFISCWKSEGNQTAIVWNSAVEFRDNTRALHCSSCLVWNRYLQKLGCKIFFCVVLPTSRLFLCLLQKSLMDLSKLCSSGHIYFGESAIRVQCI